MTATHKDFEVPADRKARNKRRNRRLKLVKAVPREAISGRSNAKALKRLRAAARRIATDQGTPRSGYEWAKMMRGPSKMRKEKLKADAQVEAALKAGTLLTDAQKAQLLDIPTEGYTLLCTGYRRAYKRLKAAYKAGVLKI